MNEDPNPPATETTPGPCPCVECRAARAAADMSDAEGALALGVELRKTRDQLTSVRKELSDTAEALSSAGDLIGELTALVASLRA